eukprot:1145315-Pelagomonas_calceolata.AAC.2
MSPLCYTMCSGGATLPGRGRSTPCSPAKSPKFSGSTLRSPTETLVKPLGSTRLKPRHKM